MEGQEKRLLLVITVSFLFLFAWYTWFMPAPQPPPPATGQAPAVASTAAQPRPIPGAPAPAAAFTPAARPAPLSVPALEGAGERELTVRTPLYTAKLTSRGGVIRSLTLSGFREKMGGPENPVDLVREGAGQPVLPLSGELTGVAGPLGFSGLVYAVEGGDLSLEAGGKGAITFRARTAEGVELAKTLTFDGDTYLIPCRTEILNRGSSPFAARFTLLWGPGLEPPGEKQAMPGAGASYSAAGKVEEIKAKKITAPTDLPLPRWIGSHDPYFLAALLPGTGFEGGNAARGPDGRLTVGINSAIQLPPGTSRVLTARLFAGPKEMGTLGKADPSLTQAIDLGWFSIIAKPLLWLLNRLFGLLGNYGLAIIVLSILLKVVFIPANNASFRSMRAMAALQPRINALRDKHRKDPQKLNAEIMELYKENKVNPAGGCLPILIQIPVFIALYKVLAGAIELRHAPFALWIGDLSAKDPYYVTPILMGATMFIQQKMTPTAGDPKQAQIMLFLPVIFTAMFLSLPSGLVLYWLVTNVLSIAHQGYMLRAAEKSEGKAIPSKGKKG